MCITKKGKIRLGQLAFSSLIGVFCMFGGELVWKVKGWGGREEEMKW